MRGRWGIIGDGGGVIVALKLVFVGVSKQPSLGCRTWQIKRITGEVIGRVALRIEGTDAVCTL